MTSFVIVGIFRTFHSLFSSNSICLNSYRQYKTGGDKHSDKQLLLEALFPPLSSYGLA